MTILIFLEKSILDTHLICCNGYERAYQILRPTFINKDTFKTKQGIEIDYKRNCIMSQRDFEKKVYRSDYSMDFYNDDRLDKLVENQLNYYVINSQFGNVVCVYVRDFTKVSDYDNNLDRLNLGIIKKLLNIDRIKEKQNGFWL